MASPYPANTSGASTDGARSTRVLKIASSPSVSGSTCPWCTTSRLDAGMLSRTAGAVGCSCAWATNDKVAVNNNVANKDGFLMAASVLKRGDFGTGKDIIAWRSEEQ